MQRIMLKSKIHRATVTGLELDYEGSIAIDPILLEAADILPGEQVQVLNLQNGERLITYAILGKRGAGQMMLNRMRKMVRQGSTSLEMKGRNHRIALLFRSFRRFS